jgi:hypothetical protein
MEPTIEERLAALERTWLRLEASSVFETQAIGVLLALIEACADAAKLQCRPSMRELYTKMLREQTEKFLAAAADEEPLFASQLREILKSQLDKPDQPNDESENV